MINTILGSKVGTSQAFITGLRIPVTKIMAGPCVVTQIKKVDGDGYWAVQLGFGSRRTKNISKPLQGHFKKSNSTPRYVREIRLDKEPELKVGDIVKTSDIFNVGDVISVSGTSKGKGFAGQVKRHHFAGGPRTHGQSDRERAPGSIGQGTTPGRIHKGKRMAGRMGSETKTIKNLHVILIDAEKSELTVSGPVPGIPGSLLTIKKLKAGSLKELEKETVAQVVEGEAPAGEEKSEESAGAPAVEQKPEEVKA